MTEGRKDGMKEGGTAQPAAPDGHWAVGLALEVEGAGLEAFVKAQVNHKAAGPDVLAVVTADRMQARVKDAAGRDTEGTTTDFRLHFPTTFAPGPEVGRFRCVIAGKLLEIALADIKPEDWRGMADTLTRRNATLGLSVPEGTPQAVAGLLSGNFAVAGGYVRPIYGLSKRKQDLPLLAQFYEPQTPLNWAVGLALFSLTDEDRVRAGDWQECKVADLTDRVFCLTERGAPRRGDHRQDILAEVVKLHTMRNWYYEVDTVRVGRAWKKRAVIGSQYAIPELQLVFLDLKTGKRAFPADVAVRALTVPLEVKGRRILKPDGKDIPALPPDRWKLEAIRWRWVQAFNDDLLLAPALVENGKRKGLPKKTTRGKTIRKGYLIRVADNVFTALHKLRVEGPRSEYACRLLVMLAHNLNKTEEGIAADRVFRMLGIPEDYEAKTRRKPEELVAAAVFRLKGRDIKALLVGSDEYPRIDPNRDRRKGPYYRLLRSPDYTPRTGITSKEDALAIEAEYADAKDAVEEDAQPPALPGPKDNQAVLPGMEAPPAQPIPDGKAIRAARETAGLNLRRFAEAMAGPDFSTWSRYESGRPIRVGKVTPDTWQRVRDFIAQHATKGGKGAV
jgi:hypothetical protein